MNRVLIEGSEGHDARVAKFCNNVLKLEAALWAFVDKEGNVLEYLREAVLAYREGRRAPNLVG